MEITESLLLTDNKATLDTLHRLKALGIDIAMDDFGTGYSSLSYLRKYPFDRIKIDRAFVNTASHGEQSAAIIQTIVHLGHSLGMTTVAEGVETEKDLEMLLAAGCAEGQGYLFSPPVPRDQVFDLVATHERGSARSPDPDTPAFIRSAIGARPAGRRRCRAPRRRAARALPRARSAEHADARPRRRRSAPFRGRACCRRSRRSPPASAPIAAAKACTMSGAGFGRATES